jgi:hypothetical protein
MTVIPLPEEVRHLVAEIIGEFGAGIQGRRDVAETLLIDDGRYVVRSYVADGLMSMWFVEEELVQFYDSDGNLLRTVNLLRKMEPRRRAA